MVTPLRINAGPDSMPAYMLGVSSAAGGAHISGTRWAAGITASNGSYMLQPGLYTVALYDGASNALLTSSLVTVTSATDSETSDISVPGMSKYTDADFGFSFWYPSSWKVTSVPYPGQLDRSGNLRKGFINVTGDGVEIAIGKVYSEQRTFYVLGGPCGYCASVTYFFDPALHTWMKSYPDGVGGAPDMAQAQFELTKIAKPADISNNTMGGLHIFSTEQKENAAIIPLSARNFVHIYGTTYTQQCASGCATDGGTDVKGNALLLAKTIVATDPSVATPMSAAEQIATIKAEQAAYAGQ
jgi:hypothetical protein